MGTVFKNANVLTETGFRRCDILVKNGIILDMGNLQQEGVDLKGKTVVPGLWDIHTHGANGYDFNEATAEQMEEILDFYARNGVTSVMATVMTDKDEIIKRQLATVAEVAKKFPIIKGIHLEGPFLSAEYKGAMPLSLLEIPSAEKFDEYQKCAGGLIKLITIAPELPHAAEVIKHIAKTGVAVSLGHSGASFTETMTAIKCGAKSFTHLFNAMRPIHHHTPSIIVAGLYSDNYCETIVDGKHLNCDIVRTIAKIKGDKMIAITDSLMCAGLPNGEYRLAGTPIEVVDGDCWIKGTNTRAGSTLTAIQGLRNVMKFCNYTLQQSINFFTANPARMLSMYDKAGSLEKGKLADFIVLDDNNKLLETYIAGKKVC